jgi:hypothetical protein
MLLTTNDISVDNDFKLFAQIWNKVENICKKETEDVRVSENQANSDFSDFVNKYDSTCNCHLCSDLGEFKLRYDEKGGYDIK